MCEENTCSEIRTLDFSGYDFTSQRSEHGVQIMNRAYRIAKHRYDRHGDRDDLRLALLTRYWSDAYINIEDYAASWNATCIDADLGVSLPTWTKASVDLRALYVAHELCECVERMVQALENAECGVHDHMPAAWEICML